MRDFLKNAAALLIGLVLAAGLLEIGLRLAGFSYRPWFRPDPLIGARHVAGAEGWWRKEGNGYIRINPQGFRDDDFDAAREAATFRIAVLGDSYTDAFQVDHDQIYVEVMERHLATCSALAGRPVEAMNFGVSGFGTTQEWLTWRHYASAYEPDLVLLAFTPGNDIRNNSRALEMTDTRPFAVLVGGSLEIDDAYLQSGHYRRRTGLGHRIWYRLSDIRIAQAMAFIVQEWGRREQLRQIRLEPGDADEPGLNDEAFRPPEAPEWVEAWRITEAVLAALAREVADSGATLVMTSVSRGAQVDPDPAVRRELEKRLGVEDLFYPERRLTELAKRLAVPYVPLAPGLAEWTLQSGTHVHGFGDGPGKGHWNADGHRWAGEQLGAALCELIDRGAL